MGAIGPKVTKETARRDNDGKRKQQGHCMSAYERKEGSPVRENARKGKASGRRHVRTCCSEGSAWRGKRRRQKRPGNRGGGRELLKREGKKPRPRERVHADISEIFGFEGARGVQGGFRAEEDAGRCRKIA